MIIIKLFGGLGNQMFQYCLYLKLKSQNKEVLLDGQMVDDEEYNCHQSSIFRSFYISKAADLNSEEAKTEEYTALMKKAVEKIKNDDFMYYIQPIDWIYDEKILKSDDVYADGYWQSEKYFKDCEEEVRKAFQFRSEIIDHDKEMLDKIMHCKYPVSIHVREGDYNEPVNQRVFGNICTEDYYRSAIRYFEEHHPGCKFFIFSNDINSARTRIGSIDATFIDGNSEADAGIDMFLMSRCKGHIIANSSFSWWGAWLGDSLEREIVSPAVWSREGICKDILTDYFIKIRNDGVLENMGGI